MHNKWWEKLYHSYIGRQHKIKSLRGSWMLTHLFLVDYEKYPLKDFPKISKVHRKGWTYSDWKIMDIENKDRSLYLSNRDYCKLHPFNGPQSFWIDDKLTLKYILNGTKYSDAMPEYYFLINKEGSFIPLIDYSEKKNISIDDILDLVMEKQNLAFKKMKGSLGEGFIKISYDPFTDSFKFNEKSLPPQELKQKIQSLRNYLVMEFLSPHPEIAKFCDRSMGSLRILIGKRDNGEWVDITSFMRIGVKASGMVENYSQGGVVVYLKEGEFERGHIVDHTTGKDIIVTNHPDNNLELKGIIPRYKEAKDIAYGIAQLFPVMKYLGFDFAITSNDEVKLTEINSLNSLAFQIDQPVFATPGGEFFKEARKHAR